MMDLSPRDNSKIDLTPRTCDIRFLRRHDKSPVTVAMRISVAEHISTFLSGDELFGVCFRQTERNFMKKFGKKIQRFLESEDGPTAVEYAVMLALIIVVCIATIRVVGANANASFVSTAAALVP